MKLRMKNIKNLITVIVRAFQLTKKKTKTEFKALDGVVKTIYDKGNKVALTQ